MFLPKTVCTFMLFCFHVLIVHFVIDILVFVIVNCTIVFFYSPFFHLEFVNLNIVAINHFLRLTCSSYNDEMWHVTHCKGHLEEDETFI